MADDRWWQRGVVYEIYPRSFADSDGDGIGDLRGIEEHLDHLTALGVDAVWIAPFYPSPMADFGYDVSDYCGVDAIFGTLADFDRLVAALHARNVRAIVDYVPNHTSDRHPWFEASRASRADAKRDWYIWRDPAAGGGPPNNWLSQFGGSAWTLDDRTGQYYLHSFLREQPDLNWRNPEVRAAMYDVLRFWLERGVDGFRVDVLWLLIKDAQFRDNPPNLAYRAGTTSYDRLSPVYTSDRPEVQEIVAEMRGVLDAYDDRVLIGEIYLPVKRLVAYYGPDLSGIQLPFNFQLVGAAWTAAEIARIVVDYEAALPPGAWPNWVLGNHDQPRIASRIGAAQARVAAMLLLTLRGTPTLYYGDELGMTDVTIPPGRIRDPAERNQPGVGAGRDPERTPMPWDASLGAGFTTGEPWLPLGEHARANVRDAAADPSSLLTLYRRLIALRREHRVLEIGEITAVRATGDVLSYERRLGDACFSVALNFGDRAAPIDVPAGRIVFSSDPDRRLTIDDDARISSVVLAANEGLVLDRRS